MRAYKDLEEKIIQLPDSAKPELNHFIDTLLLKSKVKSADPSCFKFDWEGGLVNLKNQYSSVELQHKALEWR